MLELIANFVNGRKCEVFGVLQLLVGEERVAWQRAGSQHPKSRQSQKMHPKLIISLKNNHILPI